MENPLVNITSEGITNPQNLIIDHSITHLPNGNKLGIMQLDDELRFNLPLNKVLLWTFLFSTKPNRLSLNSAYLEFSRPHNNIYLNMLFDSRTFSYAINHTPVLQNGKSVDIDLTQFNHFAFEYVGNKLTLWVNGKSRKSDNISNIQLSSVSMNVDQLGVVSLYNRELNKSEVAEHFVEYQVKNFTNDEVLI